MSRAVVRGSWRGTRRWCAECVPADSRPGHGSGGGLRGVGPGTGGAVEQPGCVVRLGSTGRLAAFTGAVEQGLFAPLTVFVNVEPEVLDSAPLEDLVAVANDAPGEVRVVVEMTERALVARPAELLRTVERVRDLGWGVALDDVGAEPASLAFMPLLRPDEVKLDLRLVQDRPGCSYGCQGVIVPLSARMCGIPRGRCSA